MNDKSIIVALDFSDEVSCNTFLDKIDPVLCRVKVGKELFTRCGPSLVKSIIDRKFDVFLDLKFHDIPNTVANAVAVAADLGVWMIDVHASGGRTMMEAARKVLDYDNAPLLIGVTVLTSMNKTDLNEIGVQSTPMQQVKNLATLSQQSGLDGVVCSAQETLELRNQAGDDFVLVTPGIRPAGDAQGDQQRVETPSSAIAKGSNFLVIGRPITLADKPDEKLRSIIDEIS